ncbi:rhomboid family intramembrane serine protease [Rhodovulum steppense]|uniref:Rhomboid family protein n=1 Tax=Rhodovulum steppense TaxID=540251 RepID=A0A4R1YMI4_9RHOB|nr:rhomboid family intramembrane serine protease [Rhodovulum steppense]TCM78985.1 rhomboid family protein [Rhodovulum steppense]
MAVLSRGSLLLFGLILACSGIELALWLADKGLIEPPRLRQIAYDYGGFWPGLLKGWKPNYPAQPYAMFLTYGFLHGGLAHLVVNMITLWSLGRAVLDRVGASGFVLLYTGSILGGAAGFALLASGLRPMVGASGALFGLVGGILAWAYVDRFTHRERLWPVARVVLLLVGLNVVLWWAMHGQLAWETHLGGFVVGWVLALLIDPRPVEREPAD